MAATKTVDQIEAEIDQSRNALAARQLQGVDEDPTPLLLWSQALDNGDLILEAFRQVGESLAYYRELASQNATRLAQTQQQRDTAEVENARLTQQTEDMFALLQRIDPDEVRRFVQARQVDGIH